MEHVYLISVYEIRYRILIGFYNGGKKYEIKSHRVNTGSEMRGRYILLGYIYRIRRVEENWSTK